MPVKNICHCATPPGGFGECEADQLSICRNDGSTCHHECRSPPPWLQTSEDLESWAYAEITGTTWPTPVRLTNAQRAIVMSGQFVHPNGDVYTFALPQPADAGDAVI